MDISDIRNQINDLQGEISDLSSEKRRTFAGFDDFISSTKIYIVVPIVVIILLAFSRPSFIYNNDKKEKRFSLLKFATTFLMISVAINVGIYAYNHTEN